MIVISLQMANFCLVSASIFVLMALSVSVYGAAVETSDQVYPSLQTECWDLCSMDYEHCKKFYECPEKLDQYGESKLCASCAKRSFACLQKCMERKR